MTQLTIDATAQYPRPSVPAPPEPRLLWSVLAFQLSLACLLAASIAQVLGPESQSTSTHRLQLAVAGAAAVLSVGLWIATSQWAHVTKSIVTGVAIILFVSIGWNSIHDFEASNRVLEPARFKDGRIVHAGVGLSYPVLPGFRFNLQPLMTQRVEGSEKLSSSLPHRLRFGEMAILSRQFQAAQFVQEGRAPASVILEVQRARLPDLNALVLDVRKQEAKWAGFENIQILKHTHQVNHDQLETVEFVFVEHPRRLVSRQVFFRTKTLVLNVMLNTEDERDRLLFDEFLNSIRLDDAN